MNIDDEVEGVTAGASYAAQAILSHASNAGGSISQLVAAVEKEYDPIAVSAQPEEVKLADAQLKRLQREIESQEAQLNKSRQKHEQLADEEKELQRKASAGKLSVEAEKNALKRLEVVKRLRLAEELEHETLNRNISQASQQVQSIDSGNNAGDAVMLQQVLLQGAQQQIASKAEGIEAADRKVLEFKEQEKDLQEKLDGGLLSLDEESEALTQLGQLGMMAEKTKQQKAEMHDALLLAEVEVQTIAVQIQAGPSASSTATSVAATGAAGARPGMGATALPQQYLPPPSSPVSAKTVELEARIRQLEAEKANAGLLAVPSVLPSSDADVDSMVQEWFLDDDDGQEATTQGAAAKKAARRGPAAKNAPAVSAVPAASSNVASSNVAPSNELDSEIQQLRRELEEEKSRTTHPVADPQAAATQQALQTQLHAANQQQEALQQQLRDAQKAVKSKPGKSKSGKADDTAQKEKQDALQKQLQQVQQVQQALEVQLRNAQQVQVPAAHMPAAQAAAHAHHHQTAATIFRTVTRQASDDSSGAAQQTEQLGGSMQQLRVQAQNKPTRAAEISAKLQDLESLPESEFKTLNSQATLEKHLLEQERAALVDEQAGLAHKIVGTTPVSASSDVGILQAQLTRMQGDLVVSEAERLELRSRLQDALVKSKSKPAEDGDGPTQDQIDHLNRTIKRYKALLSTSEQDALLAQDRLLKALNQSKELRAQFDGLQAQLLAAQALVQELQAKLKALKAELAAALAEMERLRAALKAAEDALAAGATAEEVAAMLREREELLRMIRALRAKIGLDELLIAGFENELAELKKLQEEAELAAMQPSGPDVGLQVNIPPPDEEVIAPLLDGYIQMAILMAQMRLEIEAEWQVKVTEEEQKRQVVEKIRDNLATQLQRAQSALTEMSTQLKASEAENAELKIEIEELKRLIAKLQAELEQANADLAALLKRIAMLNAELEALKAQLESLKAQLAEALSELNALKEAGEGSADKIAALELRVKELEDRIAELEARVRELEGLNEKLTEQLSEAEADLVFLRESLETVQAENGQLMRNLAGAKALAEARAQALAEAEDKIAELLAQIAELQRLLAESQAKEGDGGGDEFNDRDELLAEIERLKAELAVALAEADRLRAENSRLLKEAAVRGSAPAPAAAAPTDPIATGLDSDDAALRARIAELEAENADLRAQLEAMRREMELMRQRMADMEAMLKKLQAKMANETDERLTWERDKRDEFAPVKVKTVSRGSQTDNDEKNAEAQEEKTAGRALHAARLKHYKNQTYEPPVGEGKAALKWRLQAAEEQEKWLESQLLQASQDAAAELQAQLREVLKTQESLRSALQPPKKLVKVPFPRANKPLRWALKLIRTVYNDKFIADAVDNRYHHPHDDMDTFVQVRDLTTWTILQQDSSNHLGLRCNVLPEHKMALIT